MKFTLTTTAMKLAGSALLAAVEALSYASPAPAQAVTTWSQFLGNPSHSSYIVDPAISTSTASKLGVKWMANLYSPDLGSPVVAYNSTLNKEVVYVGDERADVYAIDANTGQELWSTNLGVRDAERDTPAVAPDGSVWIGTNFNATLYKLDGATGQVLCSVKAQANKPIQGSPMIVTPVGGSTTVYWDSLDFGNPVQGPIVGTTESTCSQIFLTELSSGAWTTPAYAVNGAGEPLVITGTANGTPLTAGSSEWAVDANTGKVVWTYNLYQPPGVPGGYDIGAAATISPPGNNGFANGVAYASNEYGGEYALDLNTGKPIWTYWTYPSSFGGKRYLISSVALDGNQLVYGYFYAVVSLNATTGTANWVWQSAPGVGVDSSPAIIGPSGSEVVAFADLSGAFRILSLSSGSPIYSYQTGNYTSASPAEYNGTIYLTSADGFLYAFTPGGGNGSKPSEVITSPSNGGTVPNPNGSLTLSGTATDGVGVANVEIAIQSGGTSGPWYDAATNTWNSAPVRNEATLTNPRATRTQWSFSLPVPAGGGTYEIFANAVNASQLVDKGSVASFTVSPSANQPTLHPSVFDTVPGSTFTATGNAFKPGETVTFTLFGNTVATATVGSTGNVPQTAIQVPSNASFGPTSLTLTGQTSGKPVSATIYVSNQWKQYGYSALRTAMEPNDDVISHTIFVGASVLNVDWKYQSGAAVNTTPAVVNGTAYFGNDAGVLSAVSVATGAPTWSYTIPSGQPIRTSPAIDDTGQVIFGANDGTLYVLNSKGAQVAAKSLGGDLLSPAYANGNIVIASSTGGVYSLADPGLTTNWSANAGSAVTVAPAYDAMAGLVIVGTSSGSVIAYSSATGAVKWSASPGGSISGIAIADNQVYAGSSNGNVYAFAEGSGSPKWTVAGDGSAVTALDANGYGPAFGTANGIMYDVGATGKVYYSRSYPKSATNGGGGAIVGLGGAGTDEFGASSKGYLEMMRIHDGGWLFGTGGVFGVGPVILDGMLFATSHDGNLYAFLPQGYTLPPQAITRLGSAIVTVSGNGCSP